MLGEINVTKKKDKLHLYTAFFFFKSKSEKQKRRVVAGVEGNRGW